MMKFACLFTLRCIRDMLAHASVRILTDMFPAAMFLPDPVSGLLPIQQPLLNVGDDGSFENIDAVDAASSRRSCLLYPGAKSKHWMESTSKKTILGEVVSLALLSWFKQISKVAASRCLLATVAFAPLNNQVLFHTHFILYRSRDMATKCRMESTSQNTFLGRKQSPSLALLSFWKQD
jgi:hypothetical protein